MSTCRKCIERDPHCHRCPDLDGAVMPGCMGTAANGVDEHDLEACTCPSPREKRRRQREDFQALAHRVRKLEEAVYGGGKR